MRITNRTRPYKTAEQSTFEAFIRSQRITPISKYSSCSWWVCAFGNSHSLLVSVSYFLRDKCLSHLLWQQIDWSQLGQSSNVALVLPACFNPLNYSVILSSTCGSLHFRKLCAVWIPLWEEWDLSRKVILRGIYKVIVPSRRRSWTGYLKHGSPFKSLTQYFRSLLNATIVHHLCWQRLYCILET